MAKKTRPAMLAQQLQAVRGELADAEAECGKLQAERDEAQRLLEAQKATTQAVSKDWMADARHLKSERDTEARARDFQQRRGDSLYDQVTTLYDQVATLTDQIESLKTHTFAAWIVAAIGWICFIFALCL